MVDHGGGSWEEARRQIRAAGHVLALTGAGVSAESGIPTFRGAGGLFEQHPPEDLATPEAFARDAAQVWRFYRWRRERVLAARPNPGHEALAAFARRHPLTLVTQNVDGLHQRAGSPEVIELHGSIVRSRCEDCGTRHAWEEEDAGLDVPTCRSCGARLRPDVVWYGEVLPRAALEQAFAAAGACDLALVLGTSGLVHPAAALPLHVLARQRPVIEINPERTPLSARATLHLSAPTGEALPDLLADGC